MKTILLSPQDLQVLRNPLHHDLGMVVAVMASEAEVQSGLDLNAAFKRAAGSLQGGKDDRAYVVIKIRPEREW